MIGIEEAYCNTAINALVRASSTLRQATIDEALQTIHVWGKGDTLGLDAITEISIAERIKQFDQYAILVSEERGWDANPLATSGQMHDRGQRTYFVSDPCDRSSQLQAFLEAFGDRSAKVADALDRDDAREAWEHDEKEENGLPVSITGPFTAVTCVRRGLPICAVLLNLLTQELTVACSAGVFRMALPRGPEAADLAPDDLSVATVCRRTNLIRFRQIEAGHEKRFVTFLGKTGYQESFEAIQLVHKKEMESSLHHKLPGGPSRVLYLSSLQDEEHPIGFIVANGEKVGEWIHWLPFIRFGSLEDDLGEPALRLFELSHDRPWTRDGILMSTSPVYSIFKVIDPTLGRMVLDTDRLRAFPNPSRYRATLLAIPASNYWAVQQVQQYGHRPIVF